MTQLILKGSEKKINLIKSLAGEMGLNYEVVNKKKQQVSPRHTKLVHNLKKSLKEVELAEQGKIKLKTFDEFINEL